MAAAGRWVRDVTAVYKVSRSYRYIVATITAIAIVPLAIGLIQGARVGGSALGYVVWFVVTVGVTGIVVGIVV
jgi:hypothetical protein